MLSFRERARTVLLSVEQLSAGYGSLKVLREVAFDMSRGEFVALVGRSGSGKTTLLKVIAGLLDKRSGAVMCNGKIRIVFQEPRLLPWLTVGDNVALGVPNTGSAEGTVEELLREMGIVNLRDRYPTKISGGEQQRVAVARAFAGSPEIVLMDEPFKALDALTRARLHDWLWQVLSDKDVTTLFVTHDIEEALTLADRVLILAEGRINEELDIPGTGHRPREFNVLNGAEFQDMKKQIRAAIGVAPERYQ